MNSSEARCHDLDIAGEPATATAKRIEGVATELSGESSIMAGRRSSSLKVSLRNDRRSKRVVGVADIPGCGGSVSLSQFVFVSHHSVPPRRRSAFLLDLCNSYVARRI